MPAKFPVANFKSQSEYHQYLESLTHTQLKKVATALNKILRKEYLLSTKKPKDELLADVKRLYSFNSESKLLTLINSMGIDTEELPGPSMNVRKPTKKQAAEAVKVRAAQDAKIERGRAKLAMARANREAKEAEQLRMKEEEARANIHGVWAVSHDPYGPPAAPIIQQLQVVIQGDSLAPEHCIRVNEDKVCVHGGQRVQQVPGHQQLAPW